jgi:hypothetical protein
MHAAVVFERAPSSSNDAPGEVRPFEIAEGKWTTLEFGPIAKKSRLIGKLVLPAGARVEGYAPCIMRRSAGAAAAQSWKATVLDREGKFVFDSLDAGAYLVMLATPFGIETCAIGEVAIDASTDYEETFRLAAGAIRGSLRDARTHEAIPQGFVLLLKDGAGSDTEFCGKRPAGANGEFTFPFVAPGMYRIVAFATSEKYGFEIVGSISVGAEGAAAPVDIELGPGGAVAVKVKNAAGLAVAGATLRLFDPAGRETQVSELPARTGANGEFTVRGLRLGTWSIQAELDGKKIGEGFADVREQETRNLEIVTSP